LSFGGCGSSSSADGDGNTRTESSSHPSNLVPVPAVVGLTKRQAIARFAKLRFILYVYPESNPSIPAGVVFRQSPLRVSLRPGSPVAVYISSGRHGKRVGKLEIIRPPRS
jgi:beta-lactam-binding protein with PASTA domain